MPQIKPRTLSGFMELLPPQQAQFDRMVSLLCDCYRLYGFQGLDTPLMEAAEVLLAKGGGETERQIYRLDKGGTDLALRFDLTVPLAKYVALHYNDLSFPFRRYQIGKVYRGERAQRGRFREFVQADIDVIGDGRLSLLNEAEIPSIIYRAFTTLGLSRFRIRVNNRKLLSGFYETLGLQERAPEIMRIVDKLDKQGEEAVFLALRDLGLGGETARALLDFCAITGERDGILHNLTAYAGRSERFDEGLFELRTLCTHLEDFGVPESHFAIDLSIARGLDYYTGTVYETQLLDHPEIGSICSGGRYDTLAEYYTDRKLPGVGISIGLTRLFYVLGEQNYLEEAARAPCDVLVLPLTEEYAPAIRFATELRELGLHTQLYGEDRRLKAKFSYADKLEIPYLALLGEEELLANEVTIKNMQTGEQWRKPRAEAAVFLQKALAARPSLPPIRERRA